MIFNICAAFSILFLAVCKSQENQDNLFNFDYEIPFKPKSFFFFETFQNENDFKSKWVLSSHESNKYQGEWRLEEAVGNVMHGDKGLIMKSKAKHHAISSFLHQSFSFNGSSFVLQYEVKLQSGLECGGCYLKLIQQQPHLNLSHFHDKTPFVIMFGPDKCGTDVKVHFIFIHKNPITGQYEEKHAKNPVGKIFHKFTDSLTHLYTLVIRNDNTFDVMVDMEMYMSGSLLFNMEPPVNLPKEILDPSDFKPLDWPDKELIPDPTAVKPDDWEEKYGEMIIDKDAKIPEGWLANEEEWIPDRRVIKPPDWDEELDGVWEPPLIANPVCKDAIGCGLWTPPLIKNPNFKGKWQPPLIPNPEYKGAWKARMIPNPQYYHDPHPYSMPSISAVGIEVWSMTSNILFDNIIILSDLSIALKYANVTWKLRHQLEKDKIHDESLGRIDKILIAANDQPSLWVVIILCMVIPPLLFIIICCRAPPKKEKESPKRRRFNRESADNPSNILNKSALNSNVKFQHVNNLYNVNLRLRVQEK